MLNGKVSIIDLGWASKSDNEVKKDAEFTKLCDLLQMDYKEAVASVRSPKVKRSTKSRRQVDENVDGCRTVVEGSVTRGGRYNLRSRT